MSKFYLLLFCLTAAGWCYASSEAETIPCPTLSTLHQISHKIDSTNLYNNTYIAYTSTWAIHENDLGWFVLVFDITAKSPDEALVTGIATVKALNSQVNIYAKHIADSYFCNYEDGKVLALGGEEVYDK